VTLPRAIPLPAPLRPTRRGNWRKAIVISLLGILGATIAWTISAVNPQLTCNGPLSITRGGTYSGCYQSRNPSEPAVAIMTTAAVTLDGVTIRHEGEAVTGEEGAQLTVQNSKFVALDPAEEPADQRNVYLNHPAYLVFENNSLMYGHGVLINGQNSQTDYIRIRYNTATDLGRYAPSEYIQLVQFDKVVSGSAEIAWNTMINTYGQSVVEDAINMYQSSGLDADNPIDIHDNLLIGIYPRDGSGDDFTGGGIIAGDQGGNYTTIHHNRVVSSANYGVSIAGGQENHAYENRLVSDGLADTGAKVSAPYSQGVVLWNATGAEEPTNNSIRDNVVGWVRPDGRADWWCAAYVPRTACSPNKPLPGKIGPAAEQAEQDSWWANVQEAGHVIGPDW